MSHKDRIVVLVDMDCFYCQVEENLNPSLKGKPIAVVQYNAWQGGGIIAVNYPARDKGVSRHMRGNEAKEKCPDIELVRVPNVRGKADLSKYRDAGKKVAEVLQTFTILLERASVDEAYLDITDAVKKRLENPTKIKPELLKNSHVVGFENVSDFLKYSYDNILINEDYLKLAIGGVIAEEIRAAVLEKTGYKCSAGVAHNKILAKLVCGLHKPNQQTILPQESIPILYEDLPVRKIRSLGGKFGNHLSDKLDIKTMGELIRFSEKELMNMFDPKTAIWLYNIARGIDLEPVTTRLVSKSIGCCKKFPGRGALKTTEAITHWLEELAEEISERLEKDTEENNRKAKQMVVSFAQEINKKDVSSSRTQILNSYEADKISKDAFEIIKKYCLRPDGSFHIKFLGISVGKFEDIKNSNNDITSLFKNLAAKKSDAKQKNLAEDHGLDFGKIESVTIRKFENQVLEQKQKEVNGNDSDDSISEEITSIQKKDVGSFFKQYLETLDDEVRVERNFDTSLILEENESNTTDKEIEVEEEENESNITDKEVDPINYLACSSSHQNIINEKFEESKNEDADTCPECKKIIPKTDMISHQDYHFALKIVRDEIDLYKPVKNAEPTKSIKLTKLNNKRKSKDAAGSNHKMTSFLISVPSEDIPCEECEECGRKIPLEEISDHMDYHMAKRIHLELNPVKKIGCSNNCDNSKESECNKIKAKTSKGISSFFKSK